MDVLRRLTAMALLGTIPSMVHAQSRPAGEGRVWAEIGVGAARQSSRCLDCVRSAPAAGGILVGAAGVTLARGFGVALVARVFQELGFEYTQGSRYVVAMGQYTPSRLAPITLNAGTGWATHHAEEAAEYSKNDHGAVLLGGAALRLPARSRVGVSLTVDAIQSIGWTSAYRPLLLGMGLALNIASPLPHSTSE